MAGNQPRHPRSSHWRAGCSETEPVRFGRGSSGRVQFRWRLARRPTSLVGAYKNGGKEYQPQGSPVPTNTHDFPGEAGKAVPYGVYDVGANSGWVNVGVDADTGMFAVESIRRWWSTIGSPAYPDADRLLITADGGGSNGHRPWLWKFEIARLAAETGLTITVCHLPPGTSKWSRGRDRPHGRPPARIPMALRLAWGPGSEAVDLDAAGDADDAGLIFAGGEVAGLLRGPWAGPVGPVADEESRVEDLEQEGGQGQVSLVRGENPP